MRCPYDVVQLQFVCARYRAVEVWKVTIAPKPASLGTASPLRHKTQPMLVRRPWIISTPQESNRFLTLQPSSVATRKRLSRLQSTSASWSGFGSPNKPDPVWVDTHKGVPVLIAESKPTNPCKVCLGRGKVVCGTCDGKGRTNGLQHRMLPSGMWPKWCSSCRGSGLWYCQRCMGTGMKRDPIGFHLPHEGSESDDD